MAHVMESSTSTSPRRCAAARITSAAPGTNPVNSVLCQAQVNAQFTYQGPSMLIIFSSVIKTLLLWICFLSAAEFAILCGSERPGYYIDIYTGQIIGRSVYEWELFVIPLLLMSWNNCETKLGVFSLVWQTLMSASRLLVCVRMVCASTWLEASGVSAPWDLSTMTSCSFVKVGIWVPSDWRSVCTGLHLQYKCNLLSLFLPLSVCVCLCAVCVCLFSDIDECQNGPVCQQNAACQNLPGSYRCECKPGYRFTSTGQCLGKTLSHDHTVTNHS